MTTAYEIAFGPRLKQVSRVAQENRWSASRMDDERRHTSYCRHAMPTSDWVLCDDPTCGEWHLSTNYEDYES